MGKIDEILVKVKDMAAVAGNKAQEVAEQTKLRLHLSQLRSELDSNYQKMGEIIYNLKKAGAENEDLIAMCVAEIDGQLAQIDEVQAKINEMRNEVKCPECMASNAKGALYCSRCGASLNKVGEDDTASEEAQEAGQQVLEEAVQKADQEDA